jgi:hypothetical protein
MTAVGIQGDAHHKITDNTLPGLGYISAMTAVAH